MRHFAQAAYVLAPMLVGALLHGFCMKHDWLRRLAVPVDGRRRWRGARLFGDNKTWRGFVAVGLGTGLGALLRPWLWPGVELAWPEWALRPTPGAFALGAAVGAAAMAAELPNSFWKRRAGIAPGTQAAGLRGLLFHTLDQVDLVAGVWAVHAVVAPISWRVALAAVAVVFVAHQAVTLAGFALGMRATAR